MNIYIFWQNWSPCQEHSFVKEKIGLQTHFEMRISTWRQKTNCCNDFGNHRVLMVPSKLCCLGQFVSHHVIPELVILNSLYLISKKLGSGTWRETKLGPRPWPMEGNKGKVCAVQLIWDIVATLLTSGLVCLKRNIWILFDGFWNTISIKDQ